MSVNSTSLEKAQALLLQGVLENDLDKIDTALDAGADIDHHYNNVEVPSRVGEKKVWEGDMSAVYIAVRNRHCDLAIALLERGANPLESVGKDTDSPIHQAAWKNMDKFITMAAAQGYRFSNLFVKARKPIFLANFYRNVKTLKALIAGGEDINTYDTTTPLYDLLSKENPEGRAPYIHALLVAGADIHARTPEGKELYDTINPRLFPIVTEHLVKLQEGLRCGYGAGMEAQHLLKNGKPTPELLQYCGADMQQELFTPHHWRGREAEALALFDKARAALPDYYKPRIDQVDLSALRRQVVGEEKGAMVKRYVRPAHAPEVAR